MSNRLTEMRHHTFDAPARQDFSCEGGGHGINMVSPWVTFYEKGISSKSFPVPAACVTLDSIEGTWALPRRAWLSSAARAVDLTQLTNPAGKQRTGSPLKRRAFYISGACNFDCNDQSGR